MPNYENAALYFNEKRNRHERRWHETVDGVRKRRTTPNAKWLWEMVNGPVPDGHVVHHVDFDGSNDDPANLALLTDSGHRRIHWEKNNGYRVVDGKEAKICTECGCLLPFSAFSTERHTKKGVTRAYPRAKCRACSSRIAQENQQARREEME